MLTFAVRRLLLAVPVLLGVPAFVVAYLVVDLSYGALDPRIARQG